MVRKSESINELLPLSVPAFHVLFSLVNEAKHGYAIRQDVERDSDGSVVIHIGSLYNLLRRLQSAGLIEESSQRPPEIDDDPRRRYYRLTKKGRHVLKAEAVRVRKLAVLLEEKKIMGNV